MYKLYLIVESPPSQDNNKLMVRIHEPDKPKDINWGDYVKMSLDNQNYIICKLERATSIGIGTIYIDQTLLVS